MISPGRAGECGVTPVSASSAFLAVTAVFLVTVSMRTAARLEEDDRNSEFQTGWEVRVRSGQSYIVLSPRAI